jgi:arginase family enzyme
VKSPNLIVYRGCAGDRNVRALVGAQLVGNALSGKLNVTPTYVGTPHDPQRLPWDRELAIARGDLRTLASVFDQVMAKNHTVITTMGRCAAGLATIPVIAKRRPDACILWLDAHGDQTAPDSRPQPYLGGMVLTGAAGLWDSGLGSGLSLFNVVLVGARDLEPHEQKLVDDGRLNHVSVGPEMPARLRAAIARRPVYVHIDYDVSDVALPGEDVEERAPGGLSLDTLRAIAEVIAEHEVIGVEIAEFESEWSEDHPVSAKPLLEALNPLFAAQQAERRSA